MRFDAAAALSGGRYLTPAETVDVLGSSLNVTYFDGTEDKTVQAVYVGSDVTEYIDGYQETDYFKSGLQTCIYSFSGSVVNNPSYMAVEFPAEFGLLDTEMVYTVAGITATGSDISSSVYQTPQWVWTMGGSRQVFEGRADYGLHYRARMSANYAYGEVFDYVPVSWTHQGLTSAFSQRLYFSYASPASESSTYYIAIGCPYISSDGSIDTISGTSGTSGSGSPGTTINVNVDMDETNGILRGLPDAIAGIFIPDDEAVEQFHADMQQLAQDHLGGLYESVDIIDDFVDSLDNVSATDSITVPVWNIPLAGETFVFGGGQMPLKYSQLSILYDAIAWITDFLATAAFVNMCKRKLEIFFVPESEKVE